MNHQATKNTEREPTYGVFGVLGGLVVRKEAYTRGEWHGMAE
jgi:hypothetical protein